jgi:hypothetical protein
MTGNPYPHELALGDVYITPVIPALFIAYTASVITVKILNIFKVSRFFIGRAYIFLSIMTLYMLLIDRFFIHF